MELCFKCAKPLLEKGHYGLHKDCFKAWFGLKSCEEFKHMARLDATSSEKKPEKFYHSWNSSFFQGNFKKYSATLANKGYVFKMKEESYPELPEVEYSCNRIAELLKLPVPSYYLISFQGEKTFVVENFCKTSKGKINLEHIYKYLGKEDEFDCETLIDIISKETQKYKDIVNFIRMCLFDSLIGNHDRHGRNIAFIVKPTGKSLSPIYDNPSYLGLESGGMLKAHFSPRGKVLTKASKEPTSKDYIKEFIRLGYRNVVSDFLNELKKDKILSIIEEGFFTVLMKRALAKLIEERMEECYATFK